MNSTIVKSKLGIGRKKKQKPIWKKQKPILEKKKQKQKTSEKLFYICTNCTAKLGCRAAITNFLLRMTSVLYKKNLS